MDSFSLTEVLRLIRTDSEGASSLFPSPGQHDPSELLYVFLDKLDSEDESKAVYDNSPVAQCVRGDMRIG